MKEGSYADHILMVMVQKNQIVIIVLNNSKLGFILLYHKKSLLTHSTQGHKKNPEMGGPLSKALDYS